MVKHIQTIRRQKPMNCENVFDHFVELTLKRLNYRHGIAFLCKTCLKNIYIILSEHGGCCLKINSLVL